MEKTPGAASVAGLDYRPRRSSPEAPDRCRREPERVPEPARPGALRRRDRLADPDIMRTETAVPDEVGTVVTDSAPAGVSAAPSGLTPEQMQALHAARRNGRKIARAAAVATFSGWTLVVFASITLLGGIFGLPALLLGIGMAVVARIELRGARGLRRAEPGAPGRLALNQLALGAMLCLYGAWCIFAAVTGPGPYDEQIAAGGEVAEMIQPIAALHMLVSVLVYGGLIVGGLIGTGCTSLYYFTRRGHVNAHIRKTPAWVLETLRAVG